MGDGNRTRIGVASGTDEKPASEPPVSGLEATVAPPVSGLDATVAPVSVNKRADFDALVRVDRDNYQVGRELAHGGMGRILVARDLRLGRDVAVKELLVDAGDLRVRFEREARITARLQHPAIVPVHEAGKWPSGEPFFVMKLVDGEPLDKVIKRKTTLADRMALLPNVIAVVDALAYAHRQNIIHRDLKPGNLLVGAFGETVVIDWGLAKDLTDATSDVDPNTGPYRKYSADETMAGAVMGTPVYMPPEQARGEKVDARADVYALGAVLYHVLAGRTPYGGKTAEDIIAAVLAGPPPDLDASVPPDLVTIVNKAMARDPKDRYPTGAGLADDLKRFQTGQLVGAHRYSTWYLVKRWMRRHRLTLSVAGVLLAILAVGAIVSVRQIVTARDTAEDARALAEQRKDEAETRRRAAEKLVEFTVFKLKDQLKAAGRLDLLAGVSGEVQSYYAAVAGADDSEPIEALDRRAQSFEVLAGVERLKGNLPSARKLYDQAIALRRKLLARPDATPELRRNLINTLSQLVDLDADEHRFDDGLAHGKEAVAMAEELRRREPEKDGWQEAVAIAHEHLGSLHVTRQHYPEARKEYLMGLAIFDALAAREDTPRWQTGVLNLHNNVADSYFYAWEFKKAAEEYGKAAAVGEKLVASDPKNIEWAELLAGSYERYAYALMPPEQPGDPDHAQPAVDKAIAIYRRLVAADPANLHDLEELAVVISNRSDIDKARGNLAGAMKLMREALDIRERAAEAQPGKPGARREVGLLHSNLGDLLMLQKDVAGADGEYRASLAVTDDLLKIDPNRGEWQRDRAAIFEKIADVELARGQTKQALADYGQEVAITRELASKNPSDAQAHSDFGFAQVNLADKALATDHELAVASYRGGLAERETASKLSPDNAQRKADVAEACAKLADALPTGSERTALIDRALALLDPKDPSQAELLAEIKKMKR